MAIQTDKTINTIRGKNLVGKATKEDILKLFEYIDALEMFLEEQDDNDTFGTEGWRHAIGLSD
jgi:hypothetical protein